MTKINVINILQELEVSIRGSKATPPQIFTCEQTAIEKTKKAIITSDGWRLRLRSLWTGYCVYKPHIGGFENKRTTRLEGAEADE
ncbi:hypothetical protein QTP88_022058 [Uroleucon formosanum]